METTLISSPIETKKYRHVCHPHRIDEVFRKILLVKEDLEIRDIGLKRAKKGSFAYNYAQSQMLSVLVRRPVRVASSLLIPVCLGYTQILKKKIAVFYKTYAMGYKKSSIGTSA